MPADASAQELTVYSSLPLSGAARGQTKAVNDGARQALQEAGGMAAGRPCGSSRSTTRRSGPAWTPGRVAANARRRPRRVAVAYIGEFNSGASKISIPILNEAGDPADQPVQHLQRADHERPGDQPGEPGKYYPTGDRTYFRILPNDHVQAAALVTAMRDRGCKALASCTTARCTARA